ncbi:MAG TPA: hypothetical protein VGC45_04500 [Gryllotalpicola sp.]
MTESVLIVAYDGSASAERALFWATGTILDGSVAVARGSSAD